MDLFFVLLINYAISLNRDNRYQLCFGTVYEHKTSLLRLWVDPFAILSFCLTSNVGFDHVVNCT